MRLGRPSLSLSGDLHASEEERRNREALDEHRPKLLVLEDVLRSAAALALAGLSTTAGAPIVANADDLLKAGTSARLPSQDVRCIDDGLYFVYTGGTTSASKCVAVTHRMALHELDVYPRIAPLDCSDRVLHQSSAYWGATSLGIFDIAWACGSCLVLTETGAGPVAVANSIEKASITTIGVVPSVLDALEPERCAGLRVIFTWGEALSTATALRWTEHVALLDLLIASEYWLVLFADHRERSSGSMVGSGRTGFRPVHGVRLTLRPPDNKDSEEPASARVADVDDGEVGELYLAGPAVSAIGYTDAVRNAGCFVDLHVDACGTVVRHFRTRDLALRRPDGSLEYCGRADGFAKVGGKWTDLAAIERKLVDAGCSDAALVWDEHAKQRHAAVVLKNGVMHQSLAQRASSLQRLLPKDTRLHMLGELPHNPATGKVNRGRLVQQLAAGEPVSSGTTGMSKEGRALSLGILLARRLGVSGPALLSLASRLACQLSRCCQASGTLPEGVMEQLHNWVSWHSAFGGLLPLSALVALPYVVLLLIDARATGLERFRRLVDAPLGILGAALLVCCTVTPWLLSLLVAAGAKHAEDARGGFGWLWVFWTGLPVLADQWVAERWVEVGRYATPQADAAQALRALRWLLLVPGCRENGNGSIPELHRCNYCCEWVSSGAMWRDFFYCTACTEGWETYTSKLLADGRDVPSQDPKPTVNDQCWPPKWQPCVDVIDFSEAEAKTARAQMPARVSTNGNCCCGAEQPAAAAAATPVGRVVEKCTGVGASELPGATSLAGLESLKVIAVVSALRRELGVDLAAGDVARCGSLEELEQLCAKEAAAVDVAGGCAADSSHKRPYAIFAIPRFWKAPVGWLIRLDEVPEEAAMRAACRALVRRHPGLRANPFQTPGDEAVATLCNNAAPWICFLRALLHGRAEKLLTRVAEGFLAAWPRVHVAPPAAEHDRGGGGGPEEGADGGGGEEAAAHFQYLRFESEPDLRHAAWLRARSRGFHTPASIAVLVLVPPTGDDAAGAGDAAGGGAAAGDAAAAPHPAGGAGGAGDGGAAYLHVAVNHAVCDASCIVPILADLMSMHGALRVNGREAASLAAAAAALPPCGNGLAVQEVRLRHALVGGGAQDAIDICHGFFHKRRPGHDHYACLRAGACDVLEAGAAVIGVPSDHLLVAAVASAFASITGLAEVKLTLIVPMRDGRGEGHVVSNLATTRHLKLLFRGRSLLAVALELSRRLRQREWELCDILGDDGDRVFVNVRGIPRFEGGHHEAEVVDTRKVTSRFVKNVMEMFVDQESAKSWTFSIGIRDDLDGSAFSQALRRAIWGMAVEPLSPAAQAVSPMPAPEQQEALLAPPD